MGAFTSKVGVAKKGAKSVRTTIPEAVVELMEIGGGDELEWTLVRQSRADCRAIVRKAKEVEKPK